MPALESYQVLMLPGISVQNYFQNSKFCTLSGNNFQNPARILSFVPDSIGIIYLRRTAFLHIKPQRAIATTSADPRRLLSVTPLVVWKSTALGYAMSVPRSFMRAGIHVVCLSLNTKHHSSPVRAGFLACKYMQRHANAYMHEKKR